MARLTLLFTILAASAAWCAEKPSVEERWPLTFEFDSQGADRFARVFEVDGVDIQPPECSVNFEIADLSFWRYLFFTEDQWPGNPYHWSAFVDLMLATPSGKQLSADQQRLLRADGWLVQPGIEGRTEGRVTFYAMSQKDAKLMTYAFLGALDELPQRRRANAESIAAALRSLSEQVALERRELEAQTQENEDRIERLKTKLFVGAEGVPAVTREQSGGKPHEVGLTTDQVWQALVDASLKLHEVEVELAGLEAEAEFLEKHFQGENPPSPVTGETLVNAVFENRLHLAGARARYNALKERREMTGELWFSMTSKSDELRTRKTELDWRSSFYANAVALYESAADDGQAKWTTKPEVANDGKVRIRNAGPLPH